MHNTVYTFLYNFFYHENTTNFSSYKFAKENLPLLFKLFFLKRVQSWLLSKPTYFAYNKP